MNNPRRRTHRLFSDQVGSLRLVTCLDGGALGNAVKEVVYDSFGNVLSDTNPSFPLPVGFAGGPRLPAVVP